MRYVFVLAMALSLFCGSSLGNPSAETLDEQTKKNLAKMLKESARERFQHRNLKEFLAPYGPKFIITYGRKPIADTHDYRISKEQRLAQLKREWTIPLSGSEDVFFTKVEVKHRAKEIIIEAKVAFHFFGGRQIEGRRYQLEKQQGQWKVVRLRIWPIMEELTGLTKKFDTEYWTMVEKKIDDAKTDASLGFRGRLTLLLEAHQFVLASRYAQEMTEKAPKLAEAWKARAALAHKLGFDTQAVRYAQKALQLEPSIDVPTMLKRP